MKLHEIAAGLLHWLKVNNVDVDGLEIEVRFKSQPDQVRGLAQVARETEPYAEVMPSAVWQGHFQLCGLKWKFTAPPAWQARIIERWDRS